MPLRMKVTPIALYNQDDSVFDGLIENLPVLEFERSQYYEDLFLTGWEIDSETLVNNILLETGDLGVFYTEPDFFKFAVRTWAAKNKAVWQSLYETLFYRYNPIWNKDGTLKENATETRNLLNGLTVTKTNTNDRLITENENIDDTDDTLETVNLTDSTAGNTSKNNEIDETEITDGTKINTGTQRDVKNDIVEEKVSAFNETNYTNRNKTETNTTDTRTDNLSENTSNTNLNSRTENEKGTNEEETTHTGTDRNKRDYSRERENKTSLNDSGFETTENTGTDSGTIGNNGTRTEQGNIGVTMTQTLIQEERKLVEFNIYDRIISDFKERFCLLIY